MSPIRRYVAFVILVSLAVAPVAATQPSTLPQPEVIRAYLERIPVGARVKVSRSDGSRVRGVLMLVEDDAIVVRERKRLPEPPLRIPLGQVADVELEQNGGGIGRAVAIGAAVGAAAALTVIAVLAAMFSD